MFTWIFSLAHALKDSFNLVLCKQVIQGRLLPLKDWPTTLLRKFQVLDVSVHSFFLFIWAINDKEDNHVSYILYHCSKQSCPCLINATLFFGFPFYYTVEVKFFSSCTMYRHTFLGVIPSSSLDSQMSGVQYLHHYSHTSTGSMPGCRTCWEDSVNPIGSLPTPTQQHFPVLTSSYQRRICMSFSYTQKLPFHFSQQLCGSCLATLTADGAAFQQNCIHIIQNMSIFVYHIQTALEIEE